MKKFNDVFNLQIPEDKKEKLNNLYIEKLVRDKDFKSLTIYFYAENYYNFIELDNLIKQIIESNFKKKRIEINYLIKFNKFFNNFSEHFYNVKKDIVLEFRKKNIIYSNILMDSNIIIDDNSDGNCNISFDVPSYYLYTENINNFIFEFKKIFEYRYSLKLNLIYSFNNNTITNDETYDDITYENASNNHYSNIENANLNPRHVNPESVDSKKIRTVKNRAKQKFFETGKIIYGKDTNKNIPTLYINEIDGQINFLTTKGKITAFESKVTKNNRRFVNITITDKYDSISMTLWPQNENDYAIISDRLKCDNGKDIFIQVQGSAWLSPYTKEVMIQNPISIIEISKDEVFPDRKDLSNEKRVELHLHTKMSAQDGVGEINDYIDRALSFGMKAMAITDHGVIYSFAKARQYLLKKQKNNPEYNEFKLIYGVEGYLIDDTDFNIPNNGFSYNKNDEYVVFDIETTGLNHIKDSIIEIGAVLLKDGNIVDTFSQFVNPKIHIPNRITNLTSITDNDVKDAKTIDEVIKEFKAFVGNRTIVGHNVNFDYSFINSKGKLCGVSFSDNKTIDTIHLQRVLLPDLKNSKLDTLAKELKIVNEHHHRAIDDAVCTSKCFLKLLEINDETKNSLDSNHIYNEYIKRMPMYHITLLAKNDVGRVNLYKLISYSHINYFYKKPRIPKSLLLKYKEGLIIGSACSAGQIFDAFLQSKSDEYIENKASLYDYFEIQPICNNEYLINDEKCYVSNSNDLIELNKKIISLAKKLNKPCIATCDCHFVDKEDLIYRDILMYNLHNSNVRKKEILEEQKNEINSFATNSNNPETIDGLGTLLYFRTTDEMLKEFDYLDEKTKKEIVIDNPNYIASLIEIISPVRDDKCPPYIDNCEDDLKNFCYENLKQKYGDNPPDIVMNRLKVELDSIITNGYSVMYMAAKKTIDDSLNHGYTVGSRGSVGSSFVATMCGVSEVNPLPPHYLCPNCKYTDFDSEEVKKFANETGYDLPDKKCPVCGHDLLKEGANIPFETFLGFGGDKEPDIDLNFSDEYQNEAHTFTNKMFGDGNTFKAGTITGLADKQSRGMILDYLEYKNDHRRNSHITYMVNKFANIRKSTGQHPGGIMVIPKDEDIFTFTPIQYPANKQDQNYTTHFEYHDLDKNLLKLDMLGHGVPTWIKKLYDLTGIDPTTVNISDPKIINLFKNLDSLNITSDSLGGISIGTLTIPEFGTNVAINMLLDAKPQGISDLIRISGLAHGTDVWEGNAKTLILDNVATIKEVICCRDDIMLYLIKKGLDPKLSFKIMENVRKGKGLTKDEQDEMILHEVPEWYIKSCNTIQYMFPKAHATAYVISALRVAYFKIHYPVEYYASYFSINIEDFDYNLLCTDYISVVNQINVLKGSNDNNIDNDVEDSNDKTSKTSKLLKLLYAVREMFARGINFEKINLLNSKSKDFIVIDGKIIPPFQSIPGIGEKLAQLIVDERNKKAFETIEDFKERTGISNVSFQKLESLGLFDALGHKEVEKQITLFDL